MDAPLILTLLLNKETFRFFNERRQKYFPPERNYLAAHLTLFHHLPPGEPQIITDLQQQVAGTGPFPLAVTDVKSIGKGVAYKIESGLLQQLHRTLQTAWAHWLIPQDRQKLWPHVTVQNKVTPAVAQQTLEILQTDFKPFTATGTGFQLWRYDNGPWTLLETFLFAG